MGTFEENICKDIEKKEDTFVVNEKDIIEKAQEEKK